jgi:hypothetical protein
MEPSAQNRRTEKKKKISLQKPEHKEDHTLLMPKNFHDVNTPISNGS